MKTPSLLERIEEAAQEKNSVIYLDSNVIDGEPTKVEGPFKQVRKLEETARGHINNLEAVKELTKRICSAQDIHSLLVQYPNVFITPEVLEELKREQQWVNYVIDLCRKKTKVRSSGLSRKKSKNWERARGMEKELFDDEQTAQTESLQDSANSFWGGIRQN
jgi:hypothetical protein